MHTRFGLVRFSNDIHMCHGNELKCKTIFSAKIWMQNVVNPNEAKYALKNMVAIETAAPKTIKCFLTMFRKIHKIR